MGCVELITAPMDELAAQIRSHPGQTAHGARPAHLDIPWGKTRGPEAARPLIAE
jgi:hypothetical protein